MRNPRKVLSREEYTLKALEGAFPSGEWIPEATASSSDEQNTPSSVQGEVAPPKLGEGSAPVEAPSLTIIGGTKYDGNALCDFLDTIGLNTTLIVGAGRGVEEHLFKDADRYWRVNVRKISPDPDVYGKNARKVNVEQVLSYDPTSPLLLVGSGERVKQAEAWLKRANWGREVIRIP